MKSLSLTVFSYELTHLYESGKTVEEIMEIRLLRRSKIISHLIEAIGSGKDLDLGTLILVKKQEKIKKVIEEIGVERLKPIKEKLPEDFTYE